MRPTLIALALAASLAAAPAPFLDFLSSLWSESGCRLDPNGGCLTPQGDEGPELDPNGAPAPQMDEGCHLDPNG
jgi:hypothetical protein